MPISIYGRNMGFFVALEVSIVIRFSVSVCVAAIKACIFTVRSLVAAHFCLCGFRRAVERNKNG